MKLIFIILVIIILAVSFGALYLIFLRSRFRSEAYECISNLKELSRLIFKNGEVSELQENGSIIPIDKGGLIGNRKFNTLKNITCPTCNLNYEYEPFSGSRKLQAVENSTVRIITWCPKPIHKGKRAVMLETGSVLLLEEQEFQVARSSNNEHRI